MRGNGIVGPKVKALSLSVSAGANRGCANSGTPDLIDKMVRFCSVFDNWLTNVLFALSGRFDFDAVFG
ncbi:hypothetical protein TMES_00530 [Thalassospira mesophila]|uniref:Uncharacterized protein n=1 Tax=Thalassospira mesophila TaxID=1293891 RepID=A0A1Y2L3V0_9PROT|nr:hypothetical protein TMES_00530 [Thalassospira mesophila]